MILRVDDLQQLCSVILQAVDTTEHTLITETLQLKTEGNILHLSVTNREYYVDVKLGLTDEEDFHVTVSANSFLKLISQMTTETVEFSVENNCLVINGNGKYKLPMIYEGSTLLELPEIVIDNVTSSFPIKGDILSSIYNYNSKELKKDTVVNPIQKLYYIDELGCITFSSGACVNKFTLPEKINVLLNTKLVKLFKLIMKNDTVRFELGHDKLSDDIIQTKVRLSTDNIVITDILNCEDAYLNTFPVKAIRDRAFDNYPYNVSIDKELFVSSIDRLLMFTSTSINEAYRCYSKFKFYKNKVIITNDRGEYTEELSYSHSNDNIPEDGYITTFSLKDIKLILENYTESFVNINFGGDQAAVVVKGNIYNIIPEIKTKLV